MHVDGIGVTQSAGAADAARMARDLVATVLDADPVTVALRWRFQVLVEDREKREGPAWQLHVEGFGSPLAIRHPDGAASTVRDLMAAALGVPGNTIDVEVVRSWD